MNNSVAVQALEALKFHQEQTRPIHKTNIAIEALTAVINNRKTLTPAQLWYVCSVYPESVTNEEIEKDYEELVEHDDKSLWEARLNIINKLQGEEICRIMSVLVI